MSGDLPSVLAVCTGNICRSALIASGLEARLGPAMHVASAGTHAVPGDHSPPEMIAAADTAGLDLRPHRARRLDREAVAGADLVVAAARDHRRVVAELHPRAARYAFTLPELGRIIPLVTDDHLVAVTGASPVERTRAVVRLLASLRGQATPPARAVDDDVLDPYGRAAAVYARSVRQTMPPLELLAGLLVRAL